MSSFDEEYFCPSCNAVLNNQDGFDPDCSAWTCTECGKTLYGDDVEDTMNAFDGVVWYCDNCDAILSKQIGFYDSCGTWSCTSCGHVNRISEDNIIDDDKYTCPECYSELSDQYGFSDYSDKHTCSYCGAHLIKDFSEYELIYECPNCNDRLDRQYDFSKYDDKYTCSECGSHLRKYDKYEFEIDYSYQDADDDENDDEAADDDDDDSDVVVPHSYSAPSMATMSDPVNYPGARRTHTASYTYEGQSYEAIADKYESQRWKQPTKERSSKSIDLVFKRLFVLLFKKKHIKVKLFHSELIGMKVADVVQMFKDVGFTKIKTIPVNDICDGTTERICDVEEIIINDSYSFTSMDTFPYDSKIVIKHHQKKQIAMPYSKSQMKKMHVSDLSGALRRLGFVNIKMFPVHDLVTGWITKDGTVERILLNYNDDIKKTREYDYDSVIEISYHTYKMK